MATTWTDPVLTNNINLIKQEHISELRTAVNALENATPTAESIGAEPEITTKNTAFNVNFGSTVTDLQADGEAYLGTIGAVARIDHVHPVSSLDFEGLAIRSGYTKVTTFDTPEAGSITDTLTYDGGVVTTKVTIFDTPSLGQIQTTTVSDEGSVVKVTTFNIDGSITEVVT